MKKIIGVVVLVVLVGTGWMVFSNRHRVVLEGVTPTDDVPWELSWFPDRNTEDGICVEIRTQDGTIATRSCQAPGRSYSALVFPPTLGRAIIGWVPEAEVESTLDGEIFVSDPIGDFSDGRMFVQFLTTDDLPDDATINGRPIDDGD